MHYYHFNSILQKEGWLSPAYIGVDKKGLIRYLSNQPPVAEVDLERVNGFALPGFQNVHSHAFQYGMAGLAENHAVGAQDDFWSWREAMYQCALEVNPEQVEAIATALYAEMLRHGYTHVAEFHYLHHDSNGKPYSNLAEMGERIVAAAKTSGIKLTLVPIFYQRGGFGVEPGKRQRRFVSGKVDAYLELLESSKDAIKNDENSRLGFGVHSLRAVEFNDIVQTFQQGPKNYPFHLHIAEQKREVSDCISFCGKRPVEWLYEHLPVDDRFHLVHATHLVPEEIRKLAALKANVVLCPSTEGNLGDGFFPLKEYAKLGGHWSIGTDSHIGLNPFEELRLLDYGQRLITHQRNAIEGDVAKYLVLEAFESGAKGMGIRSLNHFEIGKPLDAVVIDANVSLLSATSEKNLLPSIVYTSDSNRNMGTLINGAWVVKAQHHLSEKDIHSGFLKAIQELKNR